MTALENGRNNRSLFTPFVPPDSMRQLQPLDGNRQRSPPVVHDWCPTGCSPRRYHSHSVCNRQRKTENDFKAAVAALQRAADARPTRGNTTTLQSFVTHNGNRAENSARFQMSARMRLVSAATATHSCLRVPGLKHLVTELWHARRAWSRRTSAGRQAYTPAAPRNSSGRSAT